MCSCAARMVSVSPFMHTLWSICYLVVGMCAGHTCSIVERDGTHRTKRQANLSLPLGQPSSYELVLSNTKPHILVCCCLVIWIFGCLVLNLLLGLVPHVHRHAACLPQRDAPGADGRGPASFAWCFIHAGKRHGDDGVWARKPWGP